MSDLDFDLSMSLYVKGNGAISKSIYDFLFKVPLETNVKKKKL